MVNFFAAFLVIFTIALTYKGDRKNYTVPACIRELEKVEVTKGSNQQYKRTSAINAKNKKILKRFEIDEKYIDSTSRAATKGL